MTPHFPADALCAQLDPHALYPFHPDPSDVEAIAFAKDVCAVCPVAEACLEWALTQPFDGYAILGGTTPAERQSMRRGRNPRPSPADMDAIRRRVTELSARGLTASVIGDRLGITENAVYRARMVAKARREGQAVPRGDQDALDFGSAS